MNQRRKLWEPLETFIRNAEGMAALKASPQLRVTIRLLCIARQRSTRGIRVMRSTRPQAGTLLSVGLHAWSIVVMVDLTLQD